MEIDYLSNMLSASSAAIVALKIFGLWLVADFITGVVHWFQDTYGNPNWPILGKYLVAPNLIHHKTPRHMLQGSYIYRVGSSIVAACIIAPALWLLGWHSWEMVVCLLMASQANEVHAMAHRTKKENGKIVAFLQKLGIFQRRKSHGWHHEAPYDTNFCVMTEFLNPVLNTIRFWYWTEWFLLKLFRIKVLRGAAVRGGI
ncbi:MAG: hypothetical protein KA028_01535 [Candidatus Pacebacteria bacterium]|nr:hypothetical protein [Candidatus Paceibacterota bacterium]MBP9851713.1 hypothetical protein [Candidatus Paceibacterota bacterium]